MNWSEIYKTANAIPHQGKKGVMSCSKIGSRINCSEYEGTSTAGQAAKDGTAIHYALEKNEFPNNAPERMATFFQYCKNTIAEYEAIGWEIYAREEYYEITELTGKIDVLMRRDDDWLILDYKSGFVPVANNSYQFAGNAKLLGEREKIKGKIFSAVIQMDNKSEPYTWYAAEVNEIIESALRNKEVKAGSHCQYCAKSSICSVKNKELSKVEKTLAILNSDIITPDQAGDLYELGKMFEGAGKDIKERMNSEAKEGLKIPGTTLVPSKVTHTKIVHIGNPLDIYEELEDKGEDVNIKEFLSKCTISEFSLKELVEGDLNEKLPGHVTEVYKESKRVSYLRRVKR